MALDVNARLLTEAALCKPTPPTPSIGTEKLLLRRRMLFLGATDLSDIGTGPVCPHTLATSGANGASPVQRTTTHCQIIKVRPGRLLAASAAPSDDLGAFSKRHLSNARKGTKTDSSEF